MASNAEMLRLVQHAADLLAKTDPGGPCRTALFYLAGSSDANAKQRGDLAAQLQSVVAAMALAEATLRMVGSCLMDDPPPPDPLVPLLDKLTDGHSYTEWADASPRGMAMADTELDAVAHYLRQVDRG